MKTVLAVWMVSAAALGECGYDGKEFWVRDAAGLHRQAVASGYEGASVACGSRISALYDGDEFTIFDAVLGRFAWRNAANAFRPGPVAVSGPLAGHYDGDKFFVYDALRGVFIVEKAEPSFYYASLVAAEGALLLYDGQFLRVYGTARGDFVKEPAAKRMANHRLQSGGRLTALYDGSDLLVYDSLRGRFGRQSVSRTVFSTLAIAPRGVLFYDGKKLTGYCAESRGFATVAVPFDAFSKGFVDKTSGNPVVTVAGKAYTLDSAVCALKTR